jgi:hypothetical protein
MVVKMVCDLLQAFDDSGMPLGIGVTTRFAQNRTLSAFHVPVAFGGGFERGF